MTTRQERKFKKFKKKSNINVLLVASHDWTSLGAECARSLRSIGVPAIMMVGNKHKFKYPDQGKIFKTSAEILPYIKKATIVHFMHSQNPIPGVDLRGKKVVVSHTGTAYMKNYKKINRIFNPIVDLSIIYGFLVDRGAKNEHWLPGCVVNVEKLKPVYKRTGDKIIIGHFPSSATRTRSSKIVEIMKNVKGDFEFRYDDKLVSWEDQIKRMSACDIYLERFPDNRGFGITVLEAAALGKIVFTPFAFEDKYREDLASEFGLVNIKSVEDLVEKTEKFISLSDDKLLEMKKKSRIWVEKHHSYKAVGKSLLALYKSIL